MSKTLLLLSGFVILTVWSQLSLSEEYSESMKICLLKTIHLSDPKTTIDELSSTCENDALIVEKTKPVLSHVDGRFAREMSTENNPSVITPHYRSYLIPFSYSKNPDNVRNQQAENLTPLDNLETKFQISLKAPLFNDIFSKQDSLHFGFTIKSYWQMYNSKYSSPFRETNYQPEFFYLMKNNWKIGNWTNNVISLGLVHESNGRSQSFSRSWNRIYARFIFEKDNWIVSFKPWYRIPEKNKEFPEDPEGDDNPDILKFMGNFELRTIYHWNEQNFSITLRNNLRSNNKGAIQLDYSFPLDKRFKGYVQYFNGYGESLIDYNHSDHRIGVGILLTDFF